MNYPVWFIPGVGGGILIATIAVFHVFISHFAVGGGLYLVVAESKAVREGNLAMLDFVRSHAKFFLLVTMVLGGITGVGIWFIISLVQPGATSLLIHTFVFAWATEWVFFLVEILSILIYYYYFNSMERRTHIIIGWIYFISAWASLFIINGILGFMLTPGAWLEDHNFWSGFFNPTFWPQLFFRSFVAFMFAGLYAFLTSSFLKDHNLKYRMTKFSGKWVLGSLLAAIPCGLWYLFSLPNAPRSLVQGGSPTIQRALDIGLLVLLVILIFSLLITVWKPRFNHPVAALLVLCCTLVFMGAFEWTREAARRPFVIPGVLYSNGIEVASVDGLKEKGFLVEAKWSALKEVHQDSMLDAGRDLFRLQCYACHTIGGSNNDILPRTATMSYAVMLNYLETMHERRPFMPPFVGNQQEKEALGAFLVAGLHGKSLDLPKIEETHVSELLPGEQVFSNNCIFCHEAGLVKERTAGWDQAKIRSALDKLSSLNPAMPDFNGSADEKDSLAAYIVSLNQEGGPAVVAHDPGEDVFENYCAMCHGLEEGGNPLVKKVQGWSREEIRSALDRLPQLNSIMPPMTAPPEEKDALADFLFSVSEKGE